MVGCHHVDEPVGECFTQGCTVFGGFDGRVTLDACAEGVVVFGAEHQVGNDCLCRYLFFFNGFLLKQLQFFGGGDVGDVQTCACLLCHLHG